MKKQFKFMLLAATLMLGACQTTKTASVHKERSLDGAIHRAAHVAGSQGAIKESLVFYEELYRRNPSDMSTALQYAAALRQNSEAEKAQIILETWRLKSEDPVLLAEHAKTLIALGRLYEGKIEAEKALDKKGIGANHHILAIALDAMGEHKEAEKHFRKALKKWEGTPVIVLNNLALNLSAQQKKTDALDMVDKALIYAPYNQQLHQNRDLILALTGTPVPHSKPRS